MDRMLLVLFVSFLVIFNDGQAVTKKSTAHCQTRKQFDVQNLFAHSPSEIKGMTDKVIAQAKRVVDEILKVPNKLRTFDNTIRPIDRIFGLEIRSIQGILGIIQSFQEDKAQRAAASKANAQLAAARVKLFTGNEKLFKAFDAYYKTNADRERLSSQERYFLNELMQSLKYSGLDKDHKEREKIAALSSQLSQLLNEYSMNIATDNPRIMATREELRGMEPEFIDSLEKDDDGTYVLTLEPYILFPIIQYCQDAKTRERMWVAFANRAFPANENVLKKIIEKRKEYANAFGFGSYAAFNIEGEMAINPARVKKFLDDIKNRIKKKEKAETDLLLANVPPSVTLTPDKKFQPWDFAFAKAAYEKKHYQLDDREIAQYFPLDSTLKNLLDIYKIFLGVGFKELPQVNAWHPDVKLVEVSNIQTGQVIGYLFLDLFARARKFVQPSQITVIPAVKNSNGSQNVAVAVVLANFPKPTACQPSLLPLTDVRIFFHEFGHSLHTILGATSLALASGINVKKDFVELPSQILEEWLWDPAILKRVSRHYKTGKPLSDELITKIIESKNLNAGNLVQRQLYFAYLSLMLFDEHADKDIRPAIKKLYGDVRQSIKYDERDHEEASFDHLIDYGARYYSYIWSKVFALDVFDTIKKHGLLNPEIGKKYVDAILAPGGSADPNELLKNFLGREPNSDAFFKDLGL